MNKFMVVSCVNTKEKNVDYDGPAVVLSCTSDPSLMLFFPMSEENANVLSYILSEDGTYDINTSVLGIHTTMLNSWRASDRFLSGVIIDSVYSEESKDEVLMIRLAISDINGSIDSLVYVNFVHAIILAAMEKTPIVINDKILEKIFPSNAYQEEAETPHHHKKKKDPTFPEDKKLYDIAKNIMSGKVKDHKPEKHHKNEKRDKKSGSEE